MQNGGQILVESLVALGARRCFGVPGESYLAVLDALHDTTGKLDFILCRNEGGASFMAAAHGKLTGKPGICFVTRGPGATNASIGIHTAMQDSSPMLVFVGQVATSMKGREAFQEIDYRAVYGSMAKWAVEIDDIERMPEILSRAWVTATSGRPGPVVIALPEDMLTATSDVPVLTKAPTISEAAPTGAAITDTIDLLTEAKRPLIMIGGCNWNSTGRIAIKEFAEKAGIPVLVAFRYHDKFDNFSPVYCGEAGVGMPPHVKRLIIEADTILAINVRFGENTTDGYSVMSVPVPKQELIHVHPSDREIGKIYQPSLGIHAGPNSFAEALNQNATSVQGNWTDWCNSARADYEASIEAPDQPSPVDMAKVIVWLRKNLPQDVILTNGAGNFAIWPNKFFPFASQARLLAPQSGAMGYGFPAAIAAKLEHPNKTVVCFAGDGDFQMNLQEMATAAQAGAQPIVLLLNNGIYGTIRAHQERNYPGRVSGTTMHGNPDFAELAKTYGFHGERVEKTQDFAAAFERALKSATGALLDIAIAPEAIAPRQTLTGLRQAAQAR